MEEFEDCITIKEELLIKPDPDNDENDFIDHCYVCDKQMRHKDAGQFSRKDFTKIIQNVLEDITQDYEIVVTDGDVFCGACCNLVSRISRLEAELWAAVLRLRRLLRVKYSLPLPLLEPKVKPCVDNDECVEKYGDEKICNDFIGYCYVCDKIMCQNDYGQFSLEDLTKTIKNVLEDISQEYEIVVTHDDMLCCACRDLVADIPKLETQLRTAKLGLRALLRLKYSLPLPYMGDVRPVRHQKLQFNNTQTLGPSPRRKFIPEIQIEYGLNQVETLEAEYSRETKKEGSGKKNVQKSSVEVLHKHVKTQTLKPSPQKKSASIIKIVGSISEVESLEAGDRLRAEEAVEESFDKSDARSVQICVHTEENNCLFEEISDASEMMTLLNDDYLAEESVVVTENIGKTDKSIQTVKDESEKHQMNYEWLRCGRCWFKTKSADEMKTHISSFQNKEGFHCFICDYTYHIHDRYRRHKIAHSKVSKNKCCIFCDKKIHDKQHMRFHIEAAHKKDSFSHRCSVCSRLFMFKLSLRRHQRIRHNMRKVLKCEKCDKTFHDIIKYDNHVEYYHRESLSCKHCQKQCLSLEKLINHENKQHVIEKKETYQCRYCPRRYIRQDLLQLHEKHHTGEFKYRCSVCDYGFNEEVALERHRSTCFAVLKTLIKQTEKLPPKPVKSLSKKWFQLRDRLLVNQYKKQRKPHTHESLVCDVCGKIVTTRQKYNIHREMHDNPPKFECHLCGRLFRYKNNMQVHIKNMHTYKDTNE